MYRLSKDHTPEENAEYQRQKKAERAEKAKKTNALKKVEKKINTYEEYKTILETIELLNKNMPQIELTPIQEIVDNPNMTDNKLRLSCYHNIAAIVKKINEDLE
jgi:hypothetical protein